MSHLRFRSQGHLQCLFPSIQIHHNIDARHHNLNQLVSQVPKGAPWPYLGRNQDNDDPFKILAVGVGKLVLEHLQQVGNHIQPLGQEANPLVHLEIAAYSLVDGVQLRLSPHELWRIKDRPLKMDIDPQDEELPNLHVDLLARQLDSPRQRNRGWNFLCRVYCVVYQVLEQRGLRPLSVHGCILPNEAWNNLCALCERMADCQLGHVVLLLSKTDKVVVYPSLIFLGVIEVEVFRLYVALC